MVVASAVGTAAHGHHPLGVRHHIVGLTQYRRHLVGDGAGHDDHVCLPRSAPEYHAETIHVVSTRIIFEVNTTDRAVMEMVL